MNILFRCLRLGAALSSLTVALVAQSVASSDTTAVDRAISEEISQRFGGDRSAFLGYLRKESKTLREYRAEVASRLEPGRSQDEVHLRLIEIRRREGETDVELKARTERTVAERLHAGASFADVARDVSEARQSAGRGGDLGWLKRGDLQARFATAAFALAPGKASEALVTAGGCFVFYAEARR